jgi:arylformamidase
MKKFVELNHPLWDGMQAYPGLPAARFGAILTHEESRPRYEGKAEFYLGKVAMPCNVGTYLAGLPGIVLEGRPSAGRAVTADAGEEDLRGRAVLVKTGWDTRWGTESYWEPGPYLAEETIDLLIRSGARLVGVDFWNVDDTTDPVRPAHTRLLAAGILIVEHMCNLAALPRTGFRFYAVPLRIERGASFPVRAFAEID